MSVTIFFCYAHEDEALLKKLKAHLIPLQRQRVIDLWHDRDISAGSEWEQEISHHLHAAQIILLLISPDFMASDYCYGIEMKQALERHQREEARVIPIILRQVYWQGILGTLQALPTDAKPVRSWSDIDEALFDVTEGIRKVVMQLGTKPFSPPEVLPSQAPKRESADVSLTVLTPQPAEPPSSPQSKDTQSDRTILQAINGQDRNPDLEALKIQFHEAMLNIYKEARKIGYHATEFFHIVNENGGVETAHLLIAKDPTTGFTKLWEKKRLDLSAEALVLKPEFAPLFDEDERQKARKRLSDYEYKAP